MRTREDATHTSRRLGGSADWVVTALLVIAMIGGAAWWRWARRTDRGPSSESMALYLPRTRALIEQKVGSLEMYNKNVPEKELLDFFSRHLEGRTVQPDAFTALTDEVVERVIPLLWRDSQQRSLEERFISHRAMVTAIHEWCPQLLLSNADVILYPEDRNLRIVVAETLQDFFRDTGWHWRWIGLYVHRVPAPEQDSLKELDIYAAEVLSEFLSVFAVGTMELAGRELESDEVVLDGPGVQNILGQIIDRPRSAIATSAHDHVHYSAKTKQRIVASVPEPMFRDVTDSLQLDFEHASNPELWRRRAALETPLGIAGGGVAAGDFDGDGHVDLYFAGDAGGGLYRNLAGERFKNVGDAAGLTPLGESRAGYFVDYDNDGDLDLFVTFVYRSNRLYENNSTGVFTDVTEQRRLDSGQDVTHEAVWFDMDNDGLLDLYTANFGAWPTGELPTLGRNNDNAGPNRLYQQQLNNGQRQFVEVGADMGVADRGWTHCVGAWDYDQDGYLDLFSLNDFGASLVFRNVHGRGFDEVSHSLHLDATYNAMSFTLMDLEHDGHLSIYITQIIKLMHRQRYIKPTEETQVVFGQRNLENLRTLYGNRIYTMRRDGRYKDVHETRVEPADYGWAWDASTLDYENDGDLDLLVLNGTDNRIPVRKGETPESYMGGREFVALYASQKNLFYLSEDGYFYDVSDHCPICYVGNSRSSAFFDFDSDGDLDVAINDYEKPARIFENRQQSGNRWVRLALEGVKSNRNAVGARVRITFGDQVRYGQVVSGSGFLSQNPMTLHFGLGSAHQIDEAVIIWPSGFTQKLNGLAANRTHHVREVAKSWRTEPIGSAK